MNGNFQVGTLFGIPFFINVSWLFVLALVTLNFGSGLAAQFPWLGGNALFLGLVAGLLLFGSVLLHELGHSFAAKQQGINVRSITLFLFGGLASLEGEADTPAGAFWIAVAGPLVSVALFCILTLVSGSGLVSGPIAAIVTLLAYVNLILATFNMIPGLPLDGGNVLQAIIWKITGNRYRGIRWASRSGQVFAYLAIALGLLSILGISSFGSFWTLIVGWFLLQNARQAGRSAVFQETLSGLTIAEAVLEESPIINVDSTLAELADEAIFSSNDSRWQRFLVKDVNDQLIGTVHLDVLKSVPSDQWSNYQVQHFLSPVDKETQIQADRTLLDAISQLEEQGSQALAVIQENGTLVGLLEKSQILTLLGKKMHLKHA